ncbi:MAG: hypothetical protein B6D39_12140 [Anaerolineae bacterium UTCFX2]|jgi:hypothetical protein|nr:hypothetical protein [Anaerolineae bacterium]MCZ7554287.1 hypothetical protein [Anaerolineales bacterium]OQY87956.1 MAG: hypothetical protein B6D39_12140 [Anaerolineae bacterium UTCFX2]
MTDQEQPESEQPNLPLEKNSNWASPMQAWVCERCDWRYLKLTQETDKLRCPHCFNDSLSLYEGPWGELVYLHPPELVVHPSLPQARLDETIRQFSKGIPFAPMDLSAPQIRKRLRLVFLPVWLVDSRVQASWKMEAGFYYQVVSHQDSYDQSRSGWVSRERQETRTRWELRLGRLDREYLNVSTPALEEHRSIQKQVGNFDLSQAAAYQPEVTYQAFIRLPDRAPEDAWSGAEPGFQFRAAEECQQASQADQIRQFVWQPQFTDQNWTLLLLPVYTSYYFDDQLTPQPLIINGQTGFLTGKRRASEQRAQKTTMILFALAIMAFLIGITLAAASVAFPPALAPSVVFTILAFILGLGAVVPLARVWWFNRSQSQ